MIPSIEDFFDARCQWHGEHLGIRYELSWHGMSKYNSQGTWCYYLLINSQQFYPEDWAKLRLEREDKQYFGGNSWHRHWCYDNFPDLDAHGGWTFGEMSTYLGKDGKEYELVKVGCDYAHSWDHERGFPEGRQNVEFDAKNSINILVKMIPRRRERCGYCGIYDASEQFYTARNGARVHKTQEAKLREEKWEGWWPADAARSPHALEVRECAGSSGGQEGAGTSLLRKTQGHMRKGAGSIG